MTLAVCARTLQGQDGTTLSNAEVTVRVNATGDLADIFEDRDGNTAASNPLTASVNGTIEFYVTPGVYRLEATGAAGQETQVVDLGGVPVIPVATISDLQALNTDPLPDGQQVSVREYHEGTGRGGRVMVWDSTSTEDDNGGTVIAPDTGGGRWLWDGRGRITPYLFGARGDGVANDTPAVQEALEYVFERNYANLHFPAGRFLFEQQAAIEVGGDEREVSITGDGRESQLFSANGDGCIKIESTNRRHRVDLRNISIIPCINNAGSPFQFTQPEGGIDNRRNAVVENVYLSRLVQDTITTFEADIEKHTWSNGISLEGMNRPYVNNLIMHVQPNSAQYVTPKPQYLLNLDGCYNPTVLFSLLVGPAERGITNVRTGDNEGGRYVGTNVVRPDWPLYIDQPDRHPVVTLVNMHLNGVVGNLFIRNCKFIDIVGSWFYNAYPDPSGQIEFVDVDLRNCEHINSEILFRGSTNTARRHYALINCRDFDLNLTKRLAAEVEDTSIVQINEDCRQGIIRLPDSQETYDFKGYDQPFTEVASGAIGIREITPNTLTDSDIVSSNWTARKQTTGDPRISLQLYSGRNDAGSSLTYTRVESFASDNAEGTERGRYSISARDQGEMTELLRVLSAATSGGAALEVAVRESGVQVLRRVRVGPNGSGPGGTGRALYVDDTV